MRVMVFVKATADSDQGVVPTTKMLEAMGNFNETQNSQEKSFLLLRAKACGI